VSPSPNPPLLPQVIEGPRCNAQPSTGCSFALQLNEWKKIGAPYTILCWIKNRVPLPLHNAPQLCVLCNFHLDNLQTAFVEEELSCLLHLGAIHPLCCLETPHISPIGVVPKKNSGSQLIIDMQLLNVAISPPCFKYKDLSLLAPLLKEGDYMTMIDLKDRFFHVPILPSHQAYMPFQWEGKTYVFQVLPFGMSALPWLFTCFVQATVHHLCCQGMRVMAYMDNFIVIGHSHWQALEHMTCTLHLLNQLGLPGVTLVTLGKRGTLLCVLTFIILKNKIKVKTILVLVVLFFSQAERIERSSRVFCFAGGQDVWFLSPAFVFPAHSQ